MSVGRIIRLVRRSRRPPALLADGSHIFGDAIAGRSVVVVGPARTLLGSGAGSSIDGYDLVVRFNEGFAHPLASADVHRDFGRRVDICYANQVILRSQLLHADRWRLLECCREEGLRFIVCTNNALCYEPDGRPTPACPRADRSAPFDLCHLLHTARVETQLRMAHAASLVLHQWLGGHWGRTGFVAIFDLLTLGAARLHVTGMTFYHGGGHLLAPEHAILHPQQNRDGTLAIDSAGRGHDSFLERDAMRWLMRCFPQRLSVDDELGALLR